jgi:hypothetical protein
MRRTAEALNEEPRRGCHCACVSFRRIPFGNCQMSAGKSGIFSKTELSAVRLANDQLFVSFLPEVGAKMNSLKSVRSGREFLYQPPGDPYRRAAYGASFADYDTSGFDECCPTIAECIYPEPGFAGRKMPDHGDRWSASWDYWAGDGELFFETQGKSLPYRFQKSARRIRAVRGMVPGRAVSQVRRQLRLANSGLQGRRERGSFGTARCERSHGRQSIYLPTAGGVLRAQLSPDKGNHRISFQSAGRSVFRDMDLPGGLAVPGGREFHSRIGAVYRVPGLCSRGDP